MPQKKKKNFLLIFLNFLGLSRKKKIKKPINQEKLVKKNESF